jgi:RecG-like helicase
MKKYLFAVWFLFIAGLVFAQTAPGKEQVSQAAALLGVSETDLQKWVDSKFFSVPTDIPEITAVQLYEEYEASQPRADRAYKGKQIKVTGVVDAIEEASDMNFKKRYTLRFKTNNYSSIVQVFFDDSDVDALFDIGKGQSVSIMGTLIQKSGYIVIDHAKIIQ